MDALEGKAYALIVLKRQEEALATLEKAVRLAPERESVLASAALVAQNLGRADVAVRYGRQALKLNPYMPVRRSNLVRLLVFQESWAEAEAECQEWLRQEPGNRQARKIHITCLLRQGKKKEARTEFEQLRALATTGREELEAWFASESR
jgi:Flp pilus assembly protein TadD